MFRKDRGLIDTLLPELTGEESEAVFGHNLQNAVYRALNSSSSASSARWQKFVTS